MERTDVSLAPPLQLAWSSGTALAVATAGNDTLYGITPAGKVVALGGSNGTIRWQSASTYIPFRLALQGTRLAAFKPGEGMSYIDDTGDAASERLSLSFNASSQENIGAPVFDGQMLYLAVNQGLYADHQEKGLQFGTALGEVVPHTLGLIAPHEVVVINGRGVPTRYHATNTSFQLVWAGSPNGVDAGQMERPFAISGDRLLVGVGQQTIAYDLNTGRIAWRQPNLPAKVFAVAGGVVYAAFHGASLWAIRASDGAVLWQRQYIYDQSIQLEYSLAYSGGYLYFGSKVQTNPDRTLLISVNASDGSFTWLSRSANGPWAGGIPVTNGNSLFVFGGLATGGFEPLTTRPVLPAIALEVSPRPLRGTPTAFGQGEIKVTLSASAKVSIAAYREVQGVSALVVNDANWTAGTHSVSWAPSALFTDTRQFGHILIDIQETGGPRYTQAVLMPVNTFPDILWHWSRSSVEAMIYHRYINGYADQTFKPDNLITRAETSTIIAKTMDLLAPSPGFRTRFTDLADHWARNYIMALEEKGIIGGFAEPDGSFTFRPELNMTRAQEARILVKAYSIPAAPAGFASRFTDITRHWAEADIKGLEAAGYVTGFQEADGSFTFRPERNLTRAELCTTVVRIKKLSR